MPIFWHVSVKRERIPSSKLWCAIFVLVWVVFSGGRSLGETDSALCQEAMTTVAMRECLELQYAKADGALNRIYQQLRSQLDKPRQAKLREAQRAWIVFRDTSVEFEASEEEGGSLYSITFLSVLLTKTEQRADELETLLKGLDSR